MNFKKNKIFIMLFSCLIILLIFSLRVDAANADITIEKSSVELGDSVKITVSGKGVQWNLKLKVDGELLKTDSELENYEANKDINFSVTYQPKTAGTKKVTLEGSVTEFADGSTIKSFASKSITVKEKETTPPDTTDKNTNNGTTNSNTNANTNSNSGTTTEKPKEKSTNAYLSTLGVRIKADLAKELGVETNKYDFSGFSKTKYEYNVTVPSDVDYLKVEYKKADSNATVKVTGNSGFEVGSNNKITIKVTAEDGKTTKTYTIKVTKLAEEEEKPGNVIEDDKGLYLTSLELEGIELAEKFAKDTYSYTAILDKADVTEVVVNAVANKENASIEISGNTNLVVGENTINVVLKLDGSSVQTIYQIVVTKEPADITTVTTEESDTNLIGDLIGNMNKYLIMAVAVVVLMIVVVIVLICLLRKENKRLKNENNLEETDSEYDVYKNDENEFANKEETKEEDKVVEDISNEIETKNRGRGSRREKGKHSK